MKVNSNDYWDHRFKTDWLDYSGDEQSRFFAEVLVNALPLNLLNFIIAKNMCIADWGCAQGDGTAYFSSNITNNITGVDFSTIAIEQARDKYKTLNFVDENWLDETINHKCVFDVLISSNTLEHFHEPYKVLRKISEHVQKIIILALPFEEIDLIEEHHYSFLDDNIPINFNGKWQLTYFDAVDCTKLSPTYWGGKQIILVYCHSDWLCENNIKASDLVDLNERLEIKKNLHNLQSELNSARNVLEDKNTQLEKEKVSAVEEAERLDKLKKAYNEISEKLDEKDRIISEFKNSYLFKIYDFLRLKK